MAVTVQGIEVIYLGHLVLNGDRQVGLILHQHFHHVVHELSLGVVAVVKHQVAAAAPAVGKEKAEGQQDGGHGDPHLPGSAPVLVHLGFKPAHQQVQHHCNDHEDAGGGQNELHVGDADSLGNDAAQTAAAHEGREHGGADGVDHGDADAGEHGGEGQGELHHQHPVGLAHAHAPGGFLHAGVYLLQSQAGVPHDGEKGVQCDADDNGELAGVKKDHDDAKQCQGGDRLQ